MSCNKDLIKVLVKLQVDLGIMCNLVICNDMTMVTYSTNVK